ncbi:hypothetical protein EVAR_79047_1 [Eumeta japonica]|uniref:Uncharacterized protein n=1 Tax=Eumeta variegata TaxID=151549 RepID=A0A4C1XUM3_EUMVA|nr:hypothetical protein EVAR_79047_1 [Eumeta japonica]
MKRLYEVAPKKSDDLSLTLQQQKENLVPLSTSSWNRFPRHIIIKNRSEAPQPSRGDPASPAISKLRRSRYVPARSGHVVRYIRSAPSMRRTSGSEGRVIFKIRMCGRNRAEKPNDAPKRRGRPDKSALVFGRSSRRPRRINNARPLITRAAAMRL